MTTLLRFGLLSKAPWNRARAFVFHDHFAFQDRELELIAPSVEWADALIASTQHPATLRYEPTLANLSRRQVIEFLSTCPMGRQQPNTSAGIYPCYHFWMLDHSQPDLPIAGAICLRVGNGADLELFYGHIGYHVYPPHRGRHLAERAVRLLLPLARSHQIDPVWITCNPENQASRRTCERLGAKLVRTTALPPNHPLARGGEAAKCSFRLDAAC